MAYINGKQILNCEVHVQLQQTEITFKIDGTECKAMSGMTWGEWCNTTYNTIGAKVDTTGDEVWGIANIVHFDAGVIYLYNNLDPVLSTEQVLSKGIYTTEQSPR